VSSGCEAGVVFGPSVGPDVEGSVVGSGVVLMGGQSIPGPTMDTKSSFGSIPMLGAKFVRPSVYWPKKQRWPVHLQQSQSSWHTRNIKSD